MLSSQGNTPPRIQLCWRFQGRPSEFLHPTRYVGVCFHQLLSSLISDDQPGVHRRALIRSHQGRDQVFLNLSLDIILAQIAVASCRIHYWLKSFIIASVILHYRQCYHRTQRITQLLAALCFSIQSSSKATRSSCLHSGRLHKSSSTRPRIIRTPS